MASPSEIPAGERPIQKDRVRLQDRLLTAGLIGAGVLTLTWWTLIACGLWRAIEWVGA